MHQLGKKVKVRTFSIPEDISTKIDNNRGHESASHYVSRLLSASLNKEDKSG